MSKYSVAHCKVKNILGWIESKEIAMPEIQRPFVWNGAKVRDLINSLYHGYPVGYVIIWKNSDVRLKGGESSSGKKIIIDGQQRITSITAALLANKIIDKNYHKKRITIAFHPIKEEFEVQTPAILNSSDWIDDISIFFKADIGEYEFIDKYCGLNSCVDKQKILDSVKKIKDINNREIGVIELSDDLDVDAVADIFNRINSKGIKLSQADFAMSKIASHDELGVNLRKLIDYFCHLARAPEFYEKIEENDKDFSSTDYFDKISWLKKKSEKLYDPSYEHMLRVAFTKEFKRGKLADLVSLLSGRNFEKRTFEEKISEESFKQLETGLLDFVHEANFKKFIMIIKSTGFIASSMINSATVMNFCYSLYLLLRAEGIQEADIERYVRKWFVMSLLTGRYSGSSETKIDEDIKNIDKKGIEEQLKIIESTNLSDTFWDIQLVMNLESSGQSSHIKTFFAAQIKSSDKGLFSNSITVKDLIEHIGDFHHIFPKAYIQTKRDNRAVYNQIANYVCTQKEINIAIGKTPPKEYFSKILEASKTGDISYKVKLDGEKAFYDNLMQNCIPKDVINMDLADYDDFLEARRKLMAEKIKNYYYSL